MAKLKVEIEVQGAHNVEETAAILHIGVATVWRWIKKGELTSFKLAGRTLIPATSIREVEKLHTEGAAAAPVAAPSGSRGQSESRNKRR